MRRKFGKSGIALHPLVFGSMRLDPARLSSADACRLLSYLAEQGVSGWHSSHEYPHHAFFCETLRRVRPRDPVHVMKLGEPHFDAPRFRRERFVALIEQELHALGAERIGIVQWLLRATPNDDATRMPLLRDCIAEVEETAAALKSQGKIGALAVFPYSAATAEFCLSRGACDGLVTYLNPAERECEPFLSSMEKKGQGFLAIRPLCAGKLLDPSTEEGALFSRECETAGVAQKDRAAHALRWPLRFPAVAGVIVSLSGMEHARQAVGAISASPS